MQLDGQLLELGTATGAGFWVQLHHVVHAGSFQPLPASRGGLDTDALIFVSDGSGQYRGGRDELPVVVVNFAADQQAHALTKRGK